MAYPKIIGVEKTERARVGRKWQYIGGAQVPKYAYSPYTAKAHEQYSFYADVVMRAIIESPPRVKTQQITVFVTVGTFLSFRSMVQSGEAYARVEEIVVAKGGEGIVSLGYWRNKGGERTE
jgi:hypothetical protein